MTNAQLPRTAIERGQVAPVKLAHIVRKTSRFAEMRAWYQCVLQAEVVLQTANFAFLTYDDLTGIFGLKDMSGVGISFGLDRIYLVLEELNLFPPAVLANTKVLFINFGDKESLYAMQAMTTLRKNNIACELYPDSAKMGKQMSYADKRSIPFVILAGEKEINSESFTLKNMKSGEQSECSIQQLLEVFK